MSAEAIAIVGAGVGLLAVLVPLMLYLRRPTNGSPAAASKGPPEATAE